MRAVMIDIETLDNVPTAAIASIGAVWFEQRGTRLGKTFHQHVDLADCQHHGLTIGVDTVLWWLRQAPEAQQTLTAGQQDAAALVVALEALHAFITDHSEEAPEIWCNGASFDLPILANAYRAIGWQAPWPFWRERDLRTLKGLNHSQRLERTGLHHHALDDAIHQARLVQHILQTNPDTDA